MYTRRNLSDALTLYWRVLREEGELEVVLVNKGVSYSAIGWRPNDATTQCRLFPTIDGPPPPSRFVSNEPKATEPPSKAEPEPEPAAEGEPEPAAEGEPEPAAEGEPEPAPEGNSDNTARRGSESTPADDRVTIAFPKVESGLTARKKPDSTPGDDRVTLAFPEGFAFQPIPTAERTPKSESSGSLNEKQPLSLAGN